MQFDDVNIGGQLKVGTGVVPAIKEGRQKINGSMYAEGPVVFGEPDTYANNVATVMIGPTVNDDPDCVQPRASYGISGEIPSALRMRGGCLIEGDLYVTGSVDCLSVGRLEARHSVADGKPKVFDIHHPTKGKGHRLAHACIEGPEVGVYYRGRLRNKKVIELPQYWKGLVHTDSISVQLQPIGAHQDIIIKRWDDTKIYLQSKANFPIDCFYHVYGERKDVDGLVVEYEGETWEDHPQRKKGEVTEWETTNSTSHNTWTQ